MDHLDELKLITAWDSEPALSEEELGAALSNAALIDGGGLDPADGAWTPTYDLNAAPAAAWLIKAAKAAAVVDEPTAGIVTSRVFENCRAMARIYGRKRNSTVGLR